MHRHHVGVPRERLAAEGVVHNQPLASYTVQQLLSPDTQHWTQQLEGRRKRGSTERNNKARAHPSLVPTCGHSNGGSKPSLHHTPFTQIHTVGCGTEMCPCPSPVPPHPTHRGHQGGVCERQALQVSSQAGGHNRGGRHRLDTGRGDCGRI